MLLEVLDEDNEKKLPCRRRPSADHRGSNEELTIGYMTTR
jgi:hypothetical protein